MSSSPFGFATRTSSFSLSLSLSLSLQLPLEPPSLYAFLFRHRGWFRLSLPLTGAVSLPSPSFCRYLLPGLLPTVPEFSPPVPCFLPNYRPFRVYTYTSLPSVVKSNPLVVPCSRFFVCSFSLSLSLSLVLTHFSDKAHAGETTNTKCREKRGTTDERNRSDLRPGSEKAIWANRTPPGRGRSSG